MSLKNLWKSKKNAENQVNSGQNEDYNAYKQSPMQQALGGLHAEIKSNEHEIASLKERTKELEKQIHQYELMFDMLNKKIDSLNVRKSGKLEFIKQNLNALDSDMLDVVAKLIDKKNSEG